MMRAATADAARILIGPVEVAGVACGLQEGLRQLGHQADLALRYRHPFAYEAPPPVWRLARWWQAAGTRARETRMRWLPLKALAYAWHLLLGWPLALAAVLRYDAFVLLAGQTFTTTSFELRLMRLFGKPVVVIFLGSDARPPYINGAWTASTGGALRRATRSIKRRVTWIERWASACVNAPATAHFNERRVVNWFALGLPCSVPAMVAPSARAPRGGGVIRVVHSPSNPTVKGTSTIVATVDRLCAEGVPIELVTLTGLSNAQVLAALADCDLVVDQLWSDTPMAAFATEAAWFGKPVLVGGYFARGLAQALDGVPVPPTRFVAPEQFEAALRDLACSVETRAQLARAAHAFVAREWSCAQVASRLLRIVRDDVPAGWWFDPAQVDYLGGCGLSEAAARARVRSLVAHAGIGALALSDKPRLQAAFVRWAGVGEAEHAAPQAKAAP